MAGWSEGRLALRALARARGYAFAVVTMIALGVTAGTVLFTVYRGALLDPWPYEGGDRLLVFRGDYPAEPRHPSLWSAADFAELRELDAVFDQVIAGRGRDVNLPGPDGAERVLGATLTPNTFTMLGIQPLHGRVLNAQDVRPVAPAAVVIGHGLWQRRYGGDPGAIGAGLTIDGAPHVIVGVMPPRFLWWNSELWLPLQLDAAGARRDVRELAVQARLREGVDIRQAAAVLDTWARRVEQAHAAEYPFYAGWRVSTTLLVHAVLRDLRQVLGVLLAAVVLVVLIAGFNVANLLLARAAERRREFALRAALGASQGSMARTLLTENLILAAAGGLAGLAGARLCIDLVVDLVPYDYIPAEAYVALDPRVALFGAGLALLVAVLAVLPAGMSLRRIRVASALQEARGTGSKDAVRLRAVFVMTQVALATVVVAAALAVGSSFRNRLAQDPGFVAEGAVSTRIALPRHAYPDRTDLRRFTTALVGQLADLPGVDAAGVGIAAPLEGGPVHPVSLRARPEAAGIESRYEIVAGDWFAALGARRIAGRVFDHRDREGAQPVAVVNETFARTLLDGTDPLGMQLRAGPGGDEREWLTVVGVVGDVRVGGVDDEVRPLVYQPAAQSRVQPRNLVVLLRGDEPPAALVASARRVVTAIDPGVPVFEAASFDRILLDSMGPHRLAALLLAAYALTVLALAALGVYGILSYVTNRSGGEFALRMALGASGRDILWMIGRRSLGLAAAGIGAGSLLAALGLHLMGVLLEQPLPAAAPVLATTAALLTFVVLAACSAPAARAARTNAAAALRDA